MKSKPLLICRRRLFFFQKFINDVALGHCDELWGDFEFSGEIAQALEIVSVFLELKRIIVIDIDLLSSTTSDNMASPQQFPSHRGTIPEVIHEEVLEAREQARHASSLGGGDGDASGYIGKRKYGGAGIDLSDENSDDDKNPALIDKSPNTRRGILEESARKKVKLLNPVATFMTLIKGFICTCVLYLPRNFI